MSRYTTGEILDGKYEIIERLGAGGMGEVYKVTHTYLGSVRVIKLIHPQISESRDAHERFLREARAATKVQHPNVATLHDFSGLPDGSHYMVWEYIDGENLAQRLRSHGTLPPREAVRIAIEALHGLEAIHRAGIVHRDVSPENLMITRDTGAVKIIDLGVAKVEDPTEVSSTRTGIFVGKLRYAAPEQLGFLPEGERIDARADLYALAMVLFELLTGRPPYEAKSPHEYYIMHAREQPPKTVELPKGLPQGDALQQILERALARDRRDRFANAHEFAAALEHVERMLAHASNMRTVAVPVDADGTLRVVTPPPVGTLQRETVRTKSPAAATVRAPKPAGYRRFAVALIVLAIAIAAGLVLVGRSDRKPPPPAEELVVLEPVTTTTAASPQIAETSVEVVTTTSEPAPERIEGVVPASPVGTAATQTSALPPPRVEKPAPAARAEERPAPKEDHEETPVPTPAPAATIEAYVDGGGSGEMNSEAIQYLRSQVEGVREIEVHAGAMQAAMIAELKSELEWLQIRDSASVAIRFEGTLERLGRGRKRREAHATITRNGRVIFRYELPSEVYRVGMTPAEAFVRILTDAFVE